MSVNQLAVACLELPQRFRLSLEGLCQPLLQIADPGVVVLGRLAGNRGLGFLGLCGPWTPTTHAPPYGLDELAGDRLGEHVRVSK